MFYLGVSRHQWVKFKFRNFQNLQNTKFTKHEINHVLIYSLTSSTFKLEIKVKIDKNRYVQDMSLPTYIQ